MKENFVVNAEVRADQGKGASRRLRHTGKVPAILYGGNEAPQALVMSHNEIKNHLKTEAFYSHILTLSVGGVEQQVVLKDLHRHPVRNDDIMHLDMYRILADKALRRNVPLHFKGAEVSPGVKVAGGQLEHLANEVEVECLPKHLPEYLEVDCSTMEMNHSIHLSQLGLPEGVKLVNLIRGKDDAVCAIHAPRVMAEPVVDAAAVVAEVPAANQKAPVAAAAAGGKAAPAAKGAAPAAKAPAKKK